MEGTVCSVDLQEEAVVCCACTFPLPSLCEACGLKHRTGAGFHYLLPLSALQVLKSEHKLMQLQPRLLQLSNTCKEVYALLPEIDRCAELIESVYQELLHFAGELKVEYQEKLLMLKQGYLEAVNKAIQETSLHAFEEQTYVPEDPLARLMWEDSLNRSSNLVKFEASARCVRSYLNLAFQVAFRTSLPDLEHLNVGKLPTPIHLTAQISCEKVYNLLMQSSDTVKALKAEIEAKSNIPTDYQQLSCEIKLQNDEELLSDYLEDASCLQIKTIPFPIKLILPSNEMIPLIVESSNYIEIVRGRVKDMVGIPPDQQILFIFKSVLVDGTILADYKIRKDSIIKLALVLDPQQPFTTKTTIPQLTIMTAGDRTVGKTCFIGQFVHSEFLEEYTAHIGWSFDDAVRVVYGNYVILRLWDLNGSPSYGRFRMLKYTECDACILIYSVSDLQSFETLESILDDVRLKTGPEIIIYLVGSKADLGEKRQVAIETGEEFCKKHRLDGFAEASAKSALNVEEIIQQVAELSYQKMKAKKIKKETMALPMEQKSIFQKVADLFSPTQKTKNTEQSKEEGKPRWFK